MSDKAIKLSQAKTLYDDLRERVESVDNQVVVSDTEPQEVSNKLWIDTEEGQEYSIPTYAEFSQLSGAIDVSQPIAQNSDIGKFLKLKTIDSNGKPTAFEYGAGGSSVTVDDAFSPTSTNPVQNKVIASEINNIDEAVFSVGTGKVIAPDLFQAVTDTNIQLAIGETIFSASENAYGFYVDVSNYQGQEIMICRTNSGSVLRGVFTHDVPAVGVTYSSNNKWIAEYYTKKGAIITVPSDSSIKYMYVTYYNSSSDTITKQQALAGMSVFQADTTNYYNQASEEMMLSFSNGAYAQASSLYGFYVPVDPTASTVMIARTNTGSRFRFGFSEDVPAIGVTYTGHESSAYDTMNTVWLTVTPGAKYLYIAYYRTQDTLTKEQLRAGMTVRYNVPALIDKGKKINRIDRLDHSTGVGFVNGLLDSSGVFSDDSKHITSEFVQVDGEFFISCPSDYVMNIHFFNDNMEYVSTTEKTNGYYKFTNSGYARFTIEADDESDITPDTVDFSQIKIPGNRYSALTYTNKKTYVLDAENIKSADVFAYIDEAVASHGMYATKTLLCNESTGLPIYYYTLGNGAKKMCIIGGQHGPGSDGDPRDGVIMLAKMLHDLIEGDFANGSFLQKIHDEYTLLVIPVLNVYGFNNRKRENASNTDTNRDWVSSPTTTEVTYAKALIDNFAPGVALDVHTNGTNPIVNENIQIQFGLGSHNSTFKAAVQNKFKSYYDTDVLERTPNDTSTLQYYIINTLQALGGLLELRWWIKSKKIMHDSQAESADYAMIVNVLKYCDSVIESETYSWEKTPNQSQC